MDQYILKCISIEITIKIIWCIFQAYDITFKNNNKTF